MGWDHDSHLSQEIVSGQRGGPAGGCITYAFSLDLSDDTTIRVLGRWRSLEDIRARMVSPHMAEFNAAMMAIRPKVLNIKPYEVPREVAFG